MKLQLVGGFPGMYDVLTMPDVIYEHVCPFAEFLLLHAGAVWEANDDESGGNRKILTGFDGTCRAAEKKSSGKDTYNDRTPKQKLLEFAGRENTVGTDMVSLLEMILLLS